MKKLTVTLRRSPDQSLTVGTLAEEERRVYFEYDDAFLQTGLELTPFKLPARPGLIEHTDHTFGPLPGVFDDSLPDGWGLMLMDRLFHQRQLDPATVSPLDRLAYLGTRTMGALTYHPPQERDVDATVVELYELGRNAEEVWEGESAKVLPELIRAGGSPGGARPKVLVGIREDQMLTGEDDLPDGFEPWMIKFSARADVRDAGPIEYAYSLMARAAGIEMAETRLFEAGRDRDVRRYFGVRRFDRRAGNRRIHIHTFANIIHANFRIPSTDYADLFKVTRSLARNHRDLLRLFRIMVFNVAAHNRDDHAKNFAFMLDDETGEWSLTPAYDLTFTPGPGGEHSTTILGEGRRPDREHCLRLANQEGIKAGEASSIIDEVNAAIDSWPQFADQACCGKKITATIGSLLHPL